MILPHIQRRPLTFAHTASCRLPWRRWLKRFLDALLLAASCRLRSLEISPKN